MKLTQPAKAKNSPVQPTSTPTPPPVPPVSDSIVATAPAEVSDGGSTVPETQAPEAPQASASQDVPVAPPPSAQEAGSLRVPVIAQQILDRANDAARDAVQAVLADQAERALFDVVEGDRITIRLQSDDLTILREQWQEDNAASSVKVPFSAYLSRRLRTCREHISSRPIYLDDVTRLGLETLFGQTIEKPVNLLTMIDRTVRPVMACASTVPGEAPGAFLRLNPVDPMILELMESWFPDKDIQTALADFVDEATKEKAGLI